nr:UPF0691 protein C9orf116 homolog [Parasteatoda tepidariorum]
MALEFNDGSAQSHCSEIGKRDPEQNVVTVKFVESETTHDMQETDNLPPTFDHPSKFNYGNCVCTASDGLLKQLSENICGKKDGPAKNNLKNIHPFYRTINSDYGSKPPCVHTMPITFYPKKQKYWENLARVGMYRNCSFNTAIEKSRI